MLNLNVPESELTQAHAWWRSLSINQMKTFETKYFPNSMLPLTIRWIHQIWEKECSN